MHNAALVSIPRSFNNPVATTNVNISGTLNILMAAKEAGVKRIIYASSSSVYGDSTTVPKIEERIGKPLSPYAVSKLTNELYANVFSGNYQMEIIGLRYFNIFGPRQNPSGDYAAVIPLFMNALLNNQSPFIFGDGEQIRDFTFVENVVQANIKALFTENKSALNQVFNIAVGEKTSINQLFSILKSFINPSLEPIYKEARPGEIKNSYADISKAKVLLDYNPEVRIEEGLKITLDSFKKYFK